MRESGGANPNASEDRQSRSRTNESEDVAEGILDLADAPTVLNFDRSAVDSATSIDQAVGYRIERLDTAVRNGATDARRSLPVRTMKSELDIADDNRAKARAIDGSSESLLAPGHSSLDVLNKEHDFARPFEATPERYALLHGPADRR